MTKTLGDFQNYLNNLPQNDPEYDRGWAEAIDMVLDVVGQMYNEYDQATLEELRQRIV